MANNDKAARERRIEEIRARRAAGETWEQINETMETRKVHSNNARFVKTLAAHPEAQEQWDWHLRRVGTHKNFLDLHYGTGYIGDLTAKMWVLGVEFSETCIGAHFQSQLKARS